jgi:hypothetical protein
MLPVKAAIIVSCVIFFTGCSHVDEITPRDFVRIVVAHSTPVRKSIENNIKSINNPNMQAGVLTLPALSGISPPAYDFGWVTRGGALIIQSYQHKVTFIQEPIVQGGNVSWKCVVYPVEAMPSVCP